LNHTSGTYSFGTLPANTGDGVLSRDAFISFLTAGNLFFPPGTDFIYSTVGYYLLGYIAEKTTGQPIDRFIEEQFLRPLGMTDTGFLSRRTAVSLAGYHQYYWKGNALYTDPPTTSLGFADGMYSTATDLLTWQAALSSGSVISEASYALMTTRADTRNAEGEVVVHDYGLGLEVFVDRQGDVREVGHWGNGGGHISRLWSYPGLDITVVSLQNSNGRLEPLLDGIEALLFDSHTP
jgi:CubicO group peptidase (beta-lactamase class C family)